MNKRVYLEAESISFSEVRMVRRILGVTIGLLLLSSWAAAQQATIDLQTAAQYFKEAKSASDSDAGKLWGVRLYGPMIFVDPQSRMAVANQADAEGKLRKEGEVWVGVLPPEVGVANTATKWAGVKWTMVMWGSLSPYRQDHVRLMMHECFHRVQDELGLSAKDSVNNHLDTKDGRVWLQMEWRALERALRTQGTARKRALADALYFRAYRRAMIPAAAERENALESNEGLAEYTGLRLATSMPLRGALGWAPAPASEAALLAAIDLRQAYRKQTFVRSFAYISGPAYGVLLDDAKPGWRKGLKGELDLGALAGVAYGVTPLKPKEGLSGPPISIDGSEALARAKRYDGEEIIALETKRDERRQRELAEARKKFVDGPVLVLKPGENFGYSFNPNNVIAVDENSVVYPELKVTDAWGILNVDGGAMLVREKGMISRVVVPAPQAGAMKGDGWELELKPGWELVAEGRPGDLTVSKKK